MFTTDEHFLISDTHVREGKPCQDYALSGIHGGIAFAIVSDGCSKGGRTEIGAQLMSLSASTALRRIDARDLPQKGVVARLQDKIIKNTVSELALNVHDLVATSLYAVVTETYGFAHVRGDGVIALKDRSGQILLLRYEWKDNTPFYPAYLLDSRSRCAFVAAHGDDPDALVCASEWWRYSADEGFVLVEVKEYSLEEGMKGIDYPIPDPGQFDCIAVFSDGVFQVGDLDWKDTVRDLLAFKTVAGDFAKRRMNRHVGDARKRGGQLGDDIAYAVIRPGNPRGEVAW